MGGINWTAVAKLELTTGNISLMSSNQPIAIETSQEKNTNTLIHCKQWSHEDGKYYPVSDVTDKLIPDVYQPNVTNAGIPFFSKLNFSIEEDLLTFDDSVIDSVLLDISNFWDRKERFKRFSFPYKRGILLYGPPGSGKSCAIKLIIKQVVDKGGIGLVFGSAGVFELCLKTFRAIQPETPVVAIMEDLDGIMADQNESKILNVLDGINGFENIVYLATTNYPERLEPRIQNRPSRFDRRYHISFPNDKSRMIYLSHLQKKFKEPEGKFDIERWVQDTNNFTFAHLKELFISVFLMDTEYSEALEILHSMKKRVKAEENMGSEVGFNKMKSRNS